MPTVVSTSVSQQLGGILACELECPITGVEYNRFSDGELFLSLSNPSAISDDRVIVVGSTNSSDAHLELLLLQDAVREAGASEVVTVLPYMGYGRQDAAFETGQPVSARAVARAISTGANEVLVVTPHEDAVCDFFTPAATSVDAADVLAEPLPGDLERPVFLSPDGGAIEIATAVRDGYGRGEIDHFEKIRHSDTEVEITPSDADITGRDVVVTDDIIATGGTMSRAISVLHDRDVARVFVACVHPLFVRSAYTRLIQAGVDGVYGTDTLERQVSAVSVAPKIADVL